VVLVLAAVVLGALVAGRSVEDEEAPVPAAVPVEDPLELIAEGLAPEGLEPGPALSPDRLEARTAQATGSLSRISQWIEEYALEYGHYPAALGVGLDALAQFSEGADMERVLAPFEEGRLDYSRSVAAGGEEESFLLRGVVVGTGGREVSARGSRTRGGAPRNPAPLE
jgi:hypothetical protein